MKEPKLNRILNIGLHRNSPRLWIEGALLKAAGFKRGDRYRIIQTAPDTFVILCELDATVDDFPTIKTGVISGRTRGNREILILDCHSKLFTVGPVSVTVDDCHGSITFKMGGSN